MLLGAKGSLLTLEDFLERLPNNHQEKPQEHLIANVLGTPVTLESMERQHIEGVLGSTQGNKHQAAQILGIDRTTLYNKLKKYQISN